MNDDFDKPIDRRNTGSMKWDKYKNQDILPLWVADMDFPSPPQVIKALHKRVDHGIFGYTLPTKDTTDTVIGYIQKQHGYKIKPEWIVWSHGVVPSLNITCLAYAKSGENIITCTPVYAPFLTAPINTGRKLISVPLTIKNKLYDFDWVALEKAVTPKTKVFLLCNPHNPVGRVWTKSELKKVSDFCIRHKLVLISDEIHCDLILDRSMKHIITASLSSKIKARTVTLMSPSKTYNLPGLSCSFCIISDKKLRSAFQKASKGLITEINVFGYAALAAAYGHGEAWKKSLIPYLRDNRDFLYGFIQARIPELKLVPMSATYLAWIDARGLKMKNPAEFFEKTGVGLSSGDLFGRGGEGFVRLNFGCPRPLLKKALLRMEKAVRKIRRSPTPTS